MNIAQELKTNLLNGNFRSVSCLGLEDRPEFFTVEFGANQLQNINSAMSELMDKLGVDIYIDSKGIARFRFTGGFGPLKDSRWEYNQWSANSKRLECCLEYNIPKNQSPLRSWELTLLSVDDNTYRLWWRFYNDERDLVNPLHLCKVGKELFIKEGLTINY